MYSWTPLLVATTGNHVEVVNLLLEHKPNVNALDKDGFTALALACKDGYYDIAVALLGVGAYINIQVLFINLVFFKPKFKNIYICFRIVPVIQI